MMMTMMIILDIYEARPTLPRPRLKAKKISHLVNHFQPLTTTRLRISHNRRIGVRRTGKVMVVRRMKVREFTINGVRGHSDSVVMVEKVVAEMSVVDILVECVVALQKVVRGLTICTICDRLGHSADRCFSNLNCSSYKGGKSSAKAVTFNYDRDEESYYSANMIQLVLEGLDDNLEEVNRRSEVQPTVLHRFAMAGHTVSLETDGFPNNKIPVLLDGGCTHILFNNPGHFVDLTDMSY